MDANEITALPPIDDVAALLEALKEGLSNRATGDDWNDPEYRRIRKLLLAHPDIRDTVPEYITSCRSLQDFWDFIKSRFTTYHERRQYLANTLNPLIDGVEGTPDTIGEYALGEAIGRGGFGKVVTATHRLLNRTFAIKIFEPAFHEGGGDYLARFFQEANMLFELNHPNIIRIHDIGTIKNRPFIRMEHFKGKTLNAVLRTHGRFKPDDAVILIQLVAQALQHAHSVGVIHRDLNPQNILVAPPKQCRIIDFGLAVYLEPKLASRMTKSGHAVAGDHFTAPELLADPKHLDPRSDIYSIGAVWFAALTGRHPAGADLDERLREVEGLPDSHRQIILKCLTSEGNRFQNCEELIEAILKPQKAQASGQPSLFDCEYIGGDPRLDRNGKGQVQVDQTGITMTIFGDEWHPENVTHVWTKNEVKSACHNSNLRDEEGESITNFATVGIDDPEKIEEHGFRLMFEFKSEYFAKLFAKRCQTSLDCIPF